MTTIKHTMYGLTILVDDQDADLLRDEYYSQSKHSYPCSSVKIPLHRAVMERVLGKPLLKTEYVDHCNGNRLDARRSNLRLATPSQNQANRRKSKQTKNLYKGASRSSRNRWQSSIRTNGKFHPLGYFDTPLGAHLAYCIAALTHHGEFANFGSTSPFIGWTLEQLQAYQVEV